MNKLSKKIKDSKIVIGKHVWIKFGVSIFKRVFIIDNCIVATNSVIRKIFTEKICLIAINAIRTIRQNIEWK